MKRIFHVGSALLLAGSVLSTGCSSSQDSGGAYSATDSGAGGNSPTCSAATCAGTCSSGRCFITLSTSAQNPCDEYDLVVGRTAVYWLDAASNLVLRVPIEGGAATTIASTGAGAADQPFGLAVDADHVYWCAGMSLDGGIIARAPASGGAVTTIASGLNAPAKLATDGTNVYWAAQLSSPIPLFSMSVDGGTITTLWSGPGAGPYAVTSVFATHGQVYWATGDGRVFTVPASGGTPRQLTYEATQGMAVVADSAAAYWTNTAGNVERLPLDGGPPTVLASGQSPTYTLAIDDTSLYWINSSSPSDPCRTSAVMKVPLDGGALTTITSPHGEDFFGLGVDDTSLYTIFGTFGATQQLSVVKITPK